VVSIEVISWEIFIVIEGFILWSQWDFGLEEKQSCRKILPGNGGKLEGIAKYIGIFELPLSKAAKDSKTRVAKKPAGQPSAGVIYFAFSGEQFTRLTSNF
jgi:hypothetical protein